jgi:hypothetical protein
MNGCRIEIGNVNLTEFFRGVCFGFNFIGVIRVITYFFNQHDLPDIVVA